MSNKPAPQRIPTPEGVVIRRCPWCNAYAHLTMLTYPLNRNITNTLYGVECGALRNRHHIPEAFLTMQSAISFWNDCAKRAEGRKKQPFS